MIPLEDQRYQQAVVAMLRAMEAMTRITAAATDGKVDAQLLAEVSAKIKYANSFCRRAATQ